VSDTALRYEAGVLLALDQTLLPEREVTLELRDVDAVIDAIRRLAIRGAPMIGVAGAYGVALEARRRSAATGGLEARGELRAAAGRLRSARPTAVNLAYAVDRVLAACLDADDRAPLGPVALAEAQRIHAEEIAASRAMSDAGAELLSARGARRILTHCNTGALAVPGGGSALGVIAELARRGGIDGVIATESRPLLQGARLTVWELRRLGVAHELIVDSAAAGLIAGRAVDAVVVGCDRVAANGDVANKVGTYGLALAAAAAGIPFVVAGPVTTIDAACADGAAIEIEERDGDEVRRVAGALVTLPGTPVRNPAFDVTPAALVTALVTDRGVISPAAGEDVRALLVS
jgi:methylthioribose-1-phosphate isomerase